MINKLFYILGYGSEAKATTLETALFYKDRPLLAEQVSCPQPEKRDEKGIITQAGASHEQAFHGYNLRREHVKLSREVPFCTSLHIDFLQTAK